MKLIDLDPRWLTKDGRRVGIIFISPKNAGRIRHDGSVNPIPWRQTCFFEPLSFKEQCPIVWAAMADKADEDHEFGMWQPCAQIAWQCAGGAENASFETLSISPSIDGSKGGFWHGFITNGEIR